MECDVRIDTPKISRRHCCVAMAYDRVLVRDLGSRNQVRVNGRVVDEARLLAGDEVALGPILYRLELVEEGDDAAGPSGGHAGARGAAPGKGASGRGDKRNRPADDADLDLVPLDEF
jgi:hypothetical protein